MAAPTTAKIVSQTKTADGLMILSTVLYSNGKQLDYKSNDTNGLLVAIKNQIDQYDKIAAVVPVPPNSDVVFPPPPVPKPPTQDELDFQAFLVELRKWRQLTNGVALGLSTQKEADDQRAVYLALAKADYVFRMGA